MKAGWKMVRLGDVCKISSGKSDTVNAVPNGEYAFFDRSKVIKRSSRYLYDCEALIIPGEGTEFFPRHYSGKFDLHQRAYALFNFSDQIDVKFLFYAFHHNSGYFPSVAVGATVKSLRLRHFEEFPIPLPALPEQQRIVRILDDAFAKLDRAKDLTERNLANAKALFESYLDEVFTKRVEGWEERRLREVALEFGRGKSKHRPRNDPKLYGGPYPFIQTGDVRNSNHYISSYSQTYCELGLSQSKLWPKGTLCITIAANIAETGILTFDACFPDSVIGFVENPELAKAEYVEFAINHFKSTLQELGKGSAQDNINLATFESVTFPFPPVSEQFTIFKKLHELSGFVHSLSVNYSKMVTELEILRQSILHQAFSGEL